MKVLLLHPEDRLPRNARSHSWDRVVDFGRAPASAYELWSRQAGCPVLNLFDFAEEIQDLHDTRTLLNLGMGVLLDGAGIDWWDVLSLEITSDLQQLMLVHRLAKELKGNCELYASRPFPLASALHKLLGGPFVNLESGRKSLTRRLQHYPQVLSKLNSSQLLQVALDKFDQRHQFRRFVASPRRRCRRPVVLLPSAYLNVSRTVVGYAACLPEVEFLLMVARGSGRLTSLPPNVCMVSLDSYFGPVDQSEIKRLLDRWHVLKARLVRDAGELKSADETGVLARVPSLIRWAMALRTAWSSVFESENISACCCADDSNPYTRIPLILAKAMGLPTLACHHGALDCWMAIKTQHADFYLAKSAMERDYLLRCCRVQPESLVGPVSPSLPDPERPKQVEPEMNWLVYFSEPYQVGGWRVDEVYRELLPLLVQLAANCRLELVFKLHPFENAKAQRRMLRKYLSPEQVRRIKLIAGPPTSELWRNTRAALTAESTVVLECTARGIPVFLCAWLRHYHAGYLSQYARFGFGHILESADEIQTVAQSLTLKRALPATRESSRTVEAQILRELLAGEYASRTAVGA